MAHEELLGALEGAVRTLCAGAPVDEAAAHHGFIQLRQHSLSAARAQADALIELARMQARLDAACERVRALQGEARLYRRATASAQHPALPGSGLDAEREVRERSEAAATAAALRERLEDVCERAAEVEGRVERTRRSLTRIAASAETLLSAAPLSAELAPPTELAPALARFFVRGMALAAQGRLAFSAGCVRDDSHYTTPFERHATVLCVRIGALECTVHALVRVPVLALQASEDVIDKLSRVPCSHFPFCLYALCAPADINTDVLGHAFGWLQVLAGASLLPTAPNRDDADTEDIIKALAALTVKVDDTMELS